MGKKINFSLKKFLISNWFVTMFSTMFGVLAGLYLSHYFEQQKFIASQQSAFEKVVEEINTNHELLIANDSIMRPKFENISYFFSNFKGELGESPILIIHKDSLEIAKKKTEGIFSNFIAEEIPNKKDSLKISADSAELDFNSALAIVDLSTIAWNSYKQTNYMDITDFGCIAQIEIIYKVLTDFNELNEKFRDQLWNGDWQVSESERRVLLKRWEKVIARNETLLGALSNLDELISASCE